MKIYALLVYDKKTSKLNVYEKAFKTHESAKQFLESKGFVAETKENIIFVSKNHFCRIKELNLCESSGTNIGTPEQTRLM